MAAYLDSSVVSMSVQELQNFESIVGRNILVVIPAYNEERFIGSVVLNVKKYVDTVIVVDDGSEDNTAEIASMAGALVVREAENQGKGAAMNVGFRKALEFNPEAVVTIDADGQHVPRELPLVVGPVLEGEADLVVGSRYLEDTSEVPTHRVWGHKVFNLITKATSGTKVTDSQSGYRAFSKKAVEAISFSSAGFSVESEMQFIAKENDLRIKEVPITIYYRDAPKRSVWRQGLNVLAGILRLAGQYRPLVYIGIPSLAVAFTGFGWGIYVVDIFRRTNQLAVGYAMISVLLTIVGMVGFSTSVILHSVRGLLIDYFNKLNLD